MRCHRLTCNTGSLPARLILVQLRALDLGLVSVAQDLDSFVKNRFGLAKDASSNEGTVSVTFLSYL